MNCQDCKGVRCAECYFGSECSYRGDRRVVTCFHPEGNMEKFDADEVRTCDKYREQLDEGGSLA